MHKAEDLNDDQRVNSADARIALRIAARIETADEKLVARMDVDGDCKPTSADARAILRMAARLEG